MWSYFLLRIQTLIHCLVFHALDQHNYETSSSTQVNLMKLFQKTNRYGKSSITLSAVEPWGKTQKQLKSILLKDLSPIKLQQLSLIFILIKLVTCLIMQNIVYMTLLVYKLLRGMIYSLDSLDSFFLCTTVIFVVIWE